LNQYRRSARKTRHRIYPCDHKTTSELHLHDQEQHEHHLSLNQTNNFMRIAQTAGQSTSICSVKHPAARFLAHKAGHGCGAGGKHILRVRV
jgi:hypothetical protein